MAEECWRFGCIQAHKQWSRLCRCVRPLKDDIFGTYLLTMWSCYVMWWCCDYDFAIFSFIMLGDNVRAFICCWKLSFSLCRNHAITRYNTLLTRWNTGHTLLSRCWHVNITQMSRWYHADIRPRIAVCIARTIHARTIAVPTTHSFIRSHKRPRCHSFIHSLQIYLLPVFACVSKCLPPTTTKVSKISKEVWKLSFVSWSVKCIKSITWLKNRFRSDKCRKATEESWQTGMNICWNSVYWRRIPLLIRGIVRYSCV